ncbi:MAG: hypothetical protein JWQ38_3204 [Flavipsychrobacter sp.]|nr:hypothetical protein [Flavipsychrobacter sp.]
MKKIIITLLALAAPWASFAQQQPQYTQNQFNSNLMINPAYAGSSDCSSIGLRYRDQWAGLKGAPTTVSFIGEVKLLERLYGGICINYDKIGINRTFDINGNIAYQLKVSDKGTLALGLKLAGEFIKSDFGSLVNISPSDPLYHTNQNVTIPFVGTGVLYHTDRFYVGASAPNLVSFGNVAMRSKIIAPHYDGYGGLRITLPNEFELRPAMLVKYQPKAPIEFDFASDIWFKQLIGVGLAYRTGDAVNCMLKIRYQAYYFGYSYDIPVSGLRSFNYGSHEVFLGIDFPKNKDANKNIRYF